MYKHFYVSIFTLLIPVIFASEKKELQQEMDLLLYNKEADELLACLATGATAGIMAADILATGAITPKRIPLNIACMVAASTHLKKARRTTHDIETLLRAHPSLTLEKKSPAYLTNKQIFFMGMFLGAGLQPGIELFFGDDEHRMQNALVSAMVVEAFSAIGLLYDLCRG